MDVLSGVLRHGRRLLSAALQQVENVAWGRVDLGYTSPPEARFPYNRSLEPYCCNQPCAKTHTAVTRPDTNLISKCAVLHCIREITMLRTQRQKNTGERIWGWAFSLAI